MMKSNIKFDDHLSEIDDYDADLVGIESRYMLDGATTLAEAADLARIFADYLEELEANGYELVEVISQGKGKASQHIDSEDSFF
jgi:hypothetical protein